MESIKNVNSDKCWLEVKHYKLYIDECGDPEVLARTFYISVVNF